MPKREDRITLDEVAENIAAVREFLGDIDFERFRSEKKTQYAVIRALEIVSEAARRLSPELKARHPTIPWRQVEDSGNAYRHAYHRLQDEVVWATAHAPLDDLMAVVASELASTSEE